MHPILFTIGNFPIHSYGVLGAVGFLVVVGLSIWRAGRIGVVPDRVVDVIFWTAVAGVIGARALWVVQNPQLAPGPMDWVNVRMGGLVFYGALLAGIPAALAVMYLRKMPVLKMLDVFATALPIGHGISRLGCLFAGCCYGLPTDLPWAITFRNPLSSAPHAVAVHPTQIYEMSVLLLIGLALNLLYPNRRFNGQIILSYLGFYAVARLVVEVFRGDLSRGYFMESVLGQVLSMSQGISLAMGAIVVVGWVVLSRRAPRAEES